MAKERPQGTNEVISAILGIGAAQLAEFEPYYYLAAYASALWGGGMGTYGRLDIFVRSKTTANVQAIPAAYEEFWAWFGW